MHLTNLTQNKEDTKEVQSDSTYLWSQNKKNQMILFKEWWDYFLKQENYNHKDENGYLSEEEEVRSGKDRQAVHVLGYTGVYFLIIL